MIYSSQIKKEKNLLSMLEKGKYLIVLMGFFSFYVGIMYNEFFYFPFNVYGSCYSVENVTNKKKLNKTKM